jgi:outer membrane lipoprotein SlyB
MKIASALLPLLLAGVATAQLTQSAMTPCDNCGVVVSIRMLVQEEQWAPLGVVSAGGSPTGTGSGETRSAFAFGSDGSRGLVVIGAAGGAVYARRPNSYQKPRWDVTIKMDRGDTRVVQQRYEPLLREDDRVRGIGTQLELVGA